MRDKPYQAKQAQQIRRRVNEKVARHYLRKASEGFEVDEDLTVWHHILKVQTNSEWWIDYQDADFLLIIEAWKRNRLRGSIE